MNIKWQLNPAEQKNRDRLQRYIEQEQIASVMCNAKWFRLIKLLKSLSFSLTYRRKDVFEPEYAESGWDSDFYHVFGGTYFSIEWLEINAVKRIHIKPFARPDLAIPPDHTSELKQALLEAKIPFSMENGAVRVWGYTRPGVSPIWETT